MRVKVTRFAKYTAAAIQLDTLVSIRALALARPICISFVRAQPSQVQCQRGASGS